MCETIYEIQLDSVVSALYAYLGDYEKAQEILTLADNLTNARLNPNPNAVKREYTMRRIGL